MHYTVRGRRTHHRAPEKRLALTECYRFLPLGNAMMPNGGAAHRLPPFEQCRSREFKLLARNPFPIIRKPDKNARTRISDTNPLEYRVGVTVDDEPDQNRTNSRRPAPRSATGNSEQLQAIA